ncbi:hypothetical protein H6P81_004745 [Aristolochia fimbriata]|uniref:Uncharacterized protein n=1 Tax=Aristolochia fimbriata TaxID=158543 RepID=A0AAV7EVH0_ARIFI|nr:hypothetical protein H6P81_004745 [Aristolochia fimbriata]
MKASIAAALDSRYGLSMVERATCSASLTAVNKNLNMISCTAILLCGTKKSGTIYMVRILACHLREESSHCEKGLKLQTHPGICFRVAYRTSSFAAVGCMVKIKEEEEAFKLNSPWWGTTTGRASSPAVLSPPPEGGGGGGGGGGGPWIYRWRGI